MFLSRPFWKSLFYMFERWGTRASCASWGQTRFGLNFQDLMFKKMQIHCIYTYSTSSKDLGFNCCYFHGRSCFESNPWVYPEHSIPPSPWHPKHLAARLLGQALIFWSSSWGETCETHGIWVVTKMVDFYGGVFHRRSVFFVDLGCNLKIFVWYKDLMIWGNFTLWDDIFFSIPYI